MAQNVYILTPLLQKVYKAGKIVLLYIPFAVFKVYNIPVNVKIIFRKLSNGFDSFCRFFSLLH